MKKTCKILSGSLLVALMAFGLVKGNPVEKTGGLQVRDVLAEDVTKDVAGRIVRKADGEAPVATGKISEAKAQVSEEVEGKRHIRFVVGIDSYAYDGAHFDITFKNGEEVVKTWADQRVSYVYEAVEAAGETVTAADVFGEGYNYLIAFTVNNVPQANWNNTIEVNATVETAEQEYVGTVAEKSVQGIIDAEEVVVPEPEPQGVAYESVVNTAVNGAWVKYFLTWTDDAADIAEFITASAIDGTIGFSHTLDYCNIDNNTNKLQYGLAYASAAFQAPIEHTLTVTIKTVAGNYYNVTTRFIGASGSGVDMETVSTTVEEIAPIVVTLNAGEGTCDTASINVLAGGKYDELPNATREGYNFVGWYTDPEAGIMITSGTVVTGEYTTLYARFQEIVESQGVSYTAGINSAVNGAWVKFYLTWTDDAADIAEFVGASAIDGSINFVGTLDYCNIDNNANKLQYGLSFGSAAFQGAVQHTLTVTIKTVAGETYDVTVTFIGAGGNNVDMPIISTVATLVG